MKSLKIFISAAFILTAAACASAASQEASAAATKPAAPAEEQTTEPVPEESQPAQLSVRWIHEPDMLFSAISELTTFSFYSPSGSITEDIGYPQEWDDTWNKSMTSETADYYVLPSYREYHPDAIQVTYKDYVGIYDYNGNAITKPFPAYQGSSESPEVIYASGIGFTVDLKDPDLSEGVFTTDYQEIHCRMSSGIGWDDGLGYFLYNGSLMLGLWFNDAEPVSKIEDLNGHNCFIQIMESGDNPNLPEKVGYAAYSNDSVLRREFKGLFPSYYVNGFAAMGTKEEFNDGTGKIDYGQILLMDMNTLEPITEAVYEDAKWFENGFCPVKKNGKWGYIDETGNEVTDFLWDDATTAYEGNVYVGINGVYGVLDLASTVSQGIPITMDTCYPYGIPEGTEPEIGEIPDESIGRIKINVSNLNTRKGHSTDAEKSGVLIINSVYPTYEVFTDKEYTWYRIDEETWTADKDGKWISFSPR